MRLWKRGRVWREGLDQYTYRGMVEWAKGDQGGFGKFRKGGRKKQDRGEREKDREDKDRQGEEMREKVEKKFEVYMDFNKKEKTGGGAGGGGGSGGNNGGRDNSWSAIWKSKLYRRLLAGILAFTTYSSIKNNDGYLVDLTYEEFDKMVRERMIEKIEIEAFVGEGMKSYRAVISVGGTKRYLAIHSSDSFVHNLEEEMTRLGYSDTPIEVTYSQKTMMSNIINECTIVGLEIAKFALVFAILSAGIKFFKKLPMNNKFDSKTTAKRYDPAKDQKVLFKDVAGCKNQKQEMYEFIDFLKNPTKYSDAGAKLPKGALLSGPPGTGKTLIAKASACESEVPFFYLSGSELLTKYIGEGASKVRKLFEAARKESPAIIFIDEIDAIGKQRGGMRSNGTLNQLLVEMDGFQSKDNVIVFAASNRVNLLDSALKRPGRFDRIIEFKNPNKEEREEIFKVHLKPIKLSEGIDELAKKLAPISFGFSGADIRNVCNEAAIIASRDSKDAIELKDFQQAIDRVMGGLKNRLSLSEEDKERVAIHEAGKALVSWLLPKAPSLLKMSIVPRSKNKMGFSHYMPTEAYLPTTQAFRDKICHLLGGYYAQQIHFSEITTAAQKDLSEAFNIAESMTRVYGMSSTFPNLELKSSELGEQLYSEKTSAAIDSTIEEIVWEEGERCERVLKENWALLKALTERLKEREELGLREIEEVLGKSKNEGGEEEREDIGVIRGMQEDVEKEGKGGEQKEKEQEKEEGDKA